jgi:uncharacterized protein (TIGR02145 family)
MRKLLPIFILIYSVSYTQVRIIRSNDLEYNSHRYRVIKVPVLVNKDVDHWIYWMADDLKPSDISHVMDMKTQEGQEGPGRFVNGAFDSISFNYKGAVKSCPSGWRLPKIQDWDTLINILSDQQKMSFFSVLKGSKEIKTDTLYGNIIRMEIPLNGAYYWSYSESEDTAWRIEIEKKYYNVSKGKSDVTDFLLVRCIKDDEE